MHYLDETHIFTFLIQVLTLLVVAKLLGELFRRWGFPAMVGEILTGIVLGPTLLGRATPVFHGMLFPADPVQQTMLDTVSWFGVLFLLLVTGFEVSLKTVWQQGKATLKIGVVGVLTPLVIGVLSFWWLPPLYWGSAANRFTFSLYMATAAAISAIPVIAKVLHDLKILKSDLGLITLSAFTVNDVLGWLIFAFILGLVSQTQAGLEGVLRVFFESILFGTVCLTVGSSLVGRITRKLKVSTLPHPATTLTFISCLGLFCGIITHWIGVHAILGFFLAGIMVGNTHEISERSREIISQMVHAVFVPIFFATIGIKIDFLRNLDPLLVTVFTAVAIGGKYIGAWLGGKWARLSKEDSIALGIAHIPGGAMEIVIGLLALELQLISEISFVAVVFAALFSSVMVGPLLAWSMKQRREVEVSNFLLKPAFILDLEGKSRWKVIPEMCERVAGELDYIEEDLLVEAVINREEIMGTGLEKGVAVPHGRLKDLKDPVIVFGRSKVGIDWDARDGLASHFVFLILTPEKDENTQIQILAAVAGAMLQMDIQSKIMAAASTEEIYYVLREAMRQHGVLRLSGKKNR